MITVNNIWITDENGLEHLSPKQQALVLVYEYILSDQWGRGTPIPFYKELRKTRNINKSKLVVDKQ